jgi:hypothetical protein
MLIDQAQRNKNHTEAIFAEVRKIMEEKEK